MDKPDYMDEWEWEQYHADTMAEINEGLFDLIRKGLIEVIPGTNPPVYKLTEPFNGPDTLP